MSFNYLILIAILLLIPASAFTESKEKALTLDAIIVRGEKDALEYQTGDVDLEQSTADFTIITRDKFESKMDSLSEILEKEAGIQVRHTGGLGSYSGISIRGSSSNQVMVYMDGILVNDGSTGGADLSNFTLADVEAIEVYRGISPVNFGKTSIGGVINIRTRRTKKGFNANISAGRGSFNTKKLSGFINHKPGKYDYIVSTDFLRSDNDFKFYYHDRFWTKRKSNLVDQKNLLAKFGLDITNDLRAEFSNQYFRKQKDFPDMPNSDTGAFLNTERNIATLKLISDNMAGLNLAARVTYTSQKEEFSDLKGRIGVGTQHEEYETNTINANLFLEWPSSYHILTTNLEYNYSEMYPDNLNELSHLPLRKYSRGIFTAAIQDSLILFDERLILTPCLHSIFVADKRHPNAFEYLYGDQYIILRPEGKEDHKICICPQFGIKYHFANWLTFRSNIAKYAREPNINEMFGDRGQSKGNEDLKEEKGVNFDLGFKINWRSKNKFLQRASLNAMYFKSDIDDIIATVTDSQGTSRSVNFKDARIDGLEAEVNLKFLKFMHFSYNITTQDGRAKAFPHSTELSQLPGIYAKSYFWHIEAKYNGFNIYYEKRTEKDMFYDSTEKHGIDSKRIVNAGVSFLFDSWLFNFEARNIEDRQHYDFYLYPTPGRSYYGTVKYSFF